MKKVTASKCKSVKQVESTCLVCGAATTGTRMGVDACRACALFFKRTALLSKNYPCRRSNHKCTVTNGDRFMCRRCRFEKCKAIGMVASSEEQRQTETPVVVEEMPVVPIDCIPGPSSVVEDNEEETIMETIGKAYKICQQQRLENEQFLRQTNIYRNKEIRAPNGEIFYLITNDFNVDVLPFKLSSTMQMARIVCKEFAALSPTDQQFVVKACGATFYFLEMGYLTEKFFPGDDRYLLTSLTTTFDMNDVEEFFAGLTPEQQGNGRTAEYYVKKYIEITRPVIREANLNETEFYAALGIVMWDIGHATWIPSHILQTGEEMVEKIYKQLGKYYRETLKCEEYASRLGRLLSLIQTLREAASLAQEQYQLFKLLGICKEDDLIIKVLM